MPAPRTPRPQPQTQKDYEAIVANALNTLHLRAARLAVKYRNPKQDN